MMNLDQAIAQYEQFANFCEHHGLTASQEEFEQIAAWLRELAERRKADSCEGCVNESGKSNLLVCYTCRRHYHYADLYKPARRTE